MNNYLDSYGRYHHKPVTEANAFPSNNGFLYTAYAAKAGLPIDLVKLHECLRLSTEYVGEHGEWVRYNRSPDVELPPISRDEILGLVSLKLLSPNQIGRNFSPYPIPKFSLLQLAKQLWQLRPRYELAYNYENYLEKQWVFKHRNYFWQNNLDQLYRFAFSVPLSDRHFILKKWDKFQFYNPIHLFYAAFGKLQSKRKPNGLDWLKYGEERGLEAVKAEFPEDHPVRQKLGL